MTSGRKGQSAKLNCFLCIENYRQHGARIKRGPGAPPGDPSGPARQSRQIAFDPLPANASESIKSIGGKSNASTSIKPQMADGTNNERVPRRCFLVVLATFGNSARCIWCQCPTFLHTQVLLHGNFIFSLYFKFSMLLLQWNLFFC